MIEFEREYLSHQSTAVCIKVIGIGGAGGNTVNHMLSSEYEQVEFIVVNTDAQALKVSQAPIKLQIGPKTSRGLGAGANPECGRKAAEEDIERIRELLDGTDIVFLTAGFGGGTGSGALPVFASVARELGVLSVAVVTKPFLFEGRKRMAIAAQAIEVLKPFVDTLVVIPNERLLGVATTHVSLIEAFGMVNDTVHQFIKSIADIIARPGHINVDFADICTIMRGMGTAVMGTGCASGVDRGQKAALEAISSPLLENVGIVGARAVLLNITGSQKLGLHEVHAAASVVYDAAPDANIIMGSVIDDSMGDQVKVTIIATGMDTVEAAQIAQSVAPNAEKLVQVSVETQVITQDIELLSELESDGYEVSVATVVDQEVKECVISEVTPASVESIEVAQVIECAPELSDDEIVNKRALEYSSLPSVESFDEINISNLNSSLNTSLNSSLLSSKNSETEDLEIPAFLRRKKVKENEL